ncbi:Vegetative incompatibility protein HET-E-1 [Ceratobasidium theobromae]|uniref:Vegetative incompatibility protein HET-E-1 n=1 Tax=Ceratobasidium theobromae TaxID=1582974 RepID=A0A5N5Q899_9AGAM|nr:Vegetative incompatibility protein HET-E-1 [Ceratobasidium theobromae]
MAGTGKTTIACTFSERLEEQKQLGASFFCTRTSPECRDANQIIPTIAYQLAQCSVPFQSALCEVLSHHRDISSAKIPKQFERLLKEPLLRVKDAIQDNLVVVIDALDECENRHGVGLILDALLEFADNLPLQFFVTSRPEPEVRNKLLPRDAKTRAVLHLHEMEESLVQADIELYLKEELQFMSPTPSQIERLAERSGKLFIYAATLVCYVQPNGRPVDPHKRLNSVLSITTTPTGQYAKIDLLYATVLEEALEEKGLEKGEVEVLRLVLHTAVCVQEPVNIETLAALIRQSELEQVEVALQPLLSVLHFSHTTRVVSTLHASFPDFMFNPGWLGKYFCNVGDHGQLLARQCFEAMKNQLRFNICNLESSFLADKDVLNLKKRVDDAISPSLSYSCRYWGDHLRSAAMSNELCQALFDFLSVRLLFWMEVMNLKHEMGVGAGVLLKARSWLQVGGASSDLILLAQDSEIFVTSFAANPVSQSTPHIYISLLPFSPKSSSIYKHYWKRTRGLIEVDGGVMQHREFAALARWNVGSEVWSIAYSPDGARLAYGCLDGTIGIRNAYNGALTAGPWWGHPKTITSLGFSPDSSHLASGSEDCTIRVWTTRGGKPIADSIMGHDKAVLSVVFLLDGLRLASSSRDGPPRIWNSCDSLLSAVPFKKEFNEGVKDIALSSDGTRTIRLFALSPNGMRVASISNDGNLKIWKIVDGTPVSCQLYQNDIMSIAFSFDSTRIVSYSVDNKIRVWHADDVTLAAGPFQGHSKGAQSIAFSPNETHIVSGSDDCEEV